MKFRQTAAPKTQKIGAFTARRGIAAMAPILQALHDKGTESILMRRQAGFTLVEMAIVLVIIGLLLGGVLKGQELIESAKVKRIGQDFRAISIAVMTYQDKYRALPGDDPGANRWNGACKPTSGIQGNGQIEGGWNDTATTGSEAACVWNHLRLAGLLNGDPNGPAPNVEDGGPFGVVTQGGTVAVAGIPGTLIVCAANVRGRHVIPLDVMLDDGNPETGSMRATLSTNLAAGPAAPASAVTANESASYNVCMGF